MEIQEGKYIIERLDPSLDSSLKAWNAADELLLGSLKAQALSPKILSIYNDRFGYLSCNLHVLNPIVVTTYFSQEKAIAANLEKNQLAPLNFKQPLSEIDNKMDCALIKVPKSLALFRLYLEQIIHNSTEDLTVICAFMTRHFSPNLLKLSQEYFEEVGQSKAVKKARLLILKKKKFVSKKRTIKELKFKDQVYKQYWGVFSGSHIDYATQYFLQNIKARKADQCILDLGSGNGIIGKEISKKYPDSEIHLIDDSYLAVASAELNLTGENIHHHCNNDLSFFSDEKFDLIVSNPPFHFEYEINIQVTLNLFKECYRCLKVGGNLQVVANRHLNYLTHLKPLFSSLEILSENKKFIIYRCVK